MNSLAKIPLVVIELTGKLSEALRNFHGPSSKLCVADSEHLNEREKVTDSQAMLKGNETSARCTGSMKKSSEKLDIIK